MIPLSARNLCSLIALFILADTTLGGSLSQCTNWNLRFGWLVATCPNDANPPVQVESSLLLNQIVSANKEAQFIWSKSGGVDDHCQYHGVENGTLYGKCVLPGTNGTKLVATTLDLSSHIANLNGFLVSNFTKPAIAPAISSSVPVPIFFQLAIWLEHSMCRGPWAPTDFYSPVTCRSYDASNSTSDEIMGWSMGKNDGYELVFWHSNNCSGEPLATLGMSDAPKYCQMLPERVGSLAVRPLFNADYDVELADGRGFRWGDKCAVGEC